MKKQILVLEPYFGGSHKQFLLGIEKCIEADFIFLTLPARKWKMRMQLSAVWFVQCIAEMDNPYFDVLICSSFVDVAVLRALLTGLPKWNKDCRICTYFHENQFAYPRRLEDLAQYQFAAMNFTSALVSDKPAFNSVHNWQTFSAGCINYLKKAVDMDVVESLAKIEQEKVILYPGIFDDFKIDSEGKKINGPPVICWNHRWEHDKNPQTFFDALSEVSDRGYAFRLIVMGQSFTAIPNVMVQAKKQFADNILHFGYVPSRLKYVSLLQQSDIVVSTALHEFFGYSVLEAVRCGCLPIVPDRLCYPEIYPEYFRYKNGSLVGKLCECIEMCNRKESPKYCIDTDRFTWGSVQSQYEDWLFHG